MDVNKDSRRAHILQDIITQNVYVGKREKIEVEIRNLLKDYKAMNSKTKNLLERLGFEIFEDRRHYQIVFKNANREQF